MPEHAAKNHAAGARYMSYLLKRCSLDSMDTLATSRIAVLVQLEHGWNHVSNAWSSDPAGSRLIAQDVCSTSTLAQIGKLNGNADHVMLLHVQEPTPAAMADIQPVPND